MSPTVSRRAALADVGDRVIGQMDGVVLTDAVTAVAQAGGRYELGLRVAVAWPPQPLTGLAQEMRRRIAAAAAKSDLDAALGDIHVVIVDLRVPDDAARVRS